MKKYLEKIKKLLPFCWIMILAACLTIGGTLAFLQEKTDPVTNTFAAGKITYTLNLQANAQCVEHKDNEVEELSTFLPKVATDLSVVFENVKTPKLTGYTFRGWYYDDKCEDENVYLDVSGEEITVNYGDSHDSNSAANKVDIKLYAKWEPNKYEIIYDGNGSTDGTMSNSSHVYDVQSNLSENKYVRTGYTFKGWNTQADGNGISYKDKESIRNLTAQSGDEVRLYAQWKPINYTVVYDRNGDAEAGISGSTEKSIHTYDMDQKLTVNGYERIGYTFTNWNTKADGTGLSYADGESVKNLTSVDGEIVRLYAQWGAKTYVIHYHANGGEGTMTDQSIKYGSLTELTKNKFTRLDHSFAGWALSDAGEVKYLDGQPVLNLKESGVIDLYAVWLQDSHTVYFDYNFGNQGGTGTPASKQFQNGKAYGQLPEYPMHNPVQKSETEWMNYLFVGWYTAKEGGTRVYATTIANSIQDHTLYAHWEEAPSNNVIKDMQVYNNPDDDFNGVVDDVHLKFTCTSSFEKFNIPIKGLIPGQKYQITYNASNTASFGDYYNGYHGSVYGSYIVATRELTGGRIDGDNSTIPYYGKDILATWSDRKVPSGNLNTSETATNDGYLQGPWKDRTITFTATQETMYWTWDFGLMEDNIPYEYSITDIDIEPVAPEIQFAGKKLIVYGASNAGVKNDDSSAYASNFVFKGESYAETMYFPITGLTKGTTYTITFDHKMVGALINNSSYDYGCGISSVEPTKTGSFMDSVGASWISATKVFTASNEIESVTFTFKATGNTAYWVWNMANCKDYINCTIDLKVTNFNAKHAGGGNITYYSADSNASETLALRLEESSIEFIWDGIDDTNMEVWYPVDEQYPTAGDSYELVFEPLEGCTMAEVITVVIDGTAYEIYTNGQTVEGTAAPIYDSESNILTIPAELLTTDTNTVSIIASAVPVEISITTESEEEEEQGEITVELNITNVTAQGETALPAGNDYSFVLVPDEGYELPEIIRVDIDGTLYEVYTDGQEHRTLMEGEEELPPMPVFDPLTGTLTVPAALLSETAESMTITISAVEAVVDSKESEGSGEEVAE